jgi:hypothetical protein
MPWRNMSIKSERLKFVLEALNKQKEEIFVDYKLRRALISFI